MAVWVVRIGASRFDVEAGNRKEAKLKAARAYVRRYPNASVDTYKILTQYKIKATRGK